MIFFLLKIDYNFFDQIFASIENFCVVKRNTLHCYIRDTLDLFVSFLNWSLQNTDCRLGVKYRMQTREVFSLYYVQLSIANP